MLNPGKFIISLPILCILLISLQLSAQTDTTKPGSTARIKGIALDSTSSQPVTAALVQLQEVKDALLQYSETDKTGSFELKDIPYGSYKLQIIKNNYDTYTATIEVTSPELDLGSLQMSKNISTSEIKVESQRPFMEIQDDKKIFNVSNNIITQGKTAIDVLKTLPLVNVDGQDNVMLRGDAKIKILVNGKENRMYSNLRQVPADLIDKIEIITTPSAKYEAEGVTGIINIIFKKDAGMGYTGSVSLGGSTDKTYNNFNNFNLKKSSFSLFANFGLGSWANDFINNSRRENFLSTPSTLISNSSGNNKGQYYFGSLGAELDLTKQSVMGLEFSVNGWKGENPQATEQIFNSPSLDYTRLFSNFTKYKGISLNSSLYYNKKFDTPDRELNVDVSYGKNDWSNNFDQEEIVTPKSIIRDDRDIVGNSFTGQVDYTHPIEGVIKIEAGYKGNFSFNDNKIVVDSLNNQQNAFVLDPSRSQEFKYNNSVNGFYTTLSKGFGDVSLKLGGRLELTNTKFELGNSSTKERSYSDFFPSASLTYKFGMMNSVQLSYSRRVNRPPVWNLNPFIYVYNNQNISFGNPDLLPEYTNSFELGVNASLFGLTVSPNFFYRKTTNVITRFSYLTDTNTTVSTYDNSSKLDSYGADLVFSGQLFGAAFFNASLNFSKLSYTGTEGSSLDNEGTAFGGNAYLSLPIGPFATLEIFYNRWGDRVTAQGTNRGKNFLSLGISKMFLDNKLRVNLGVNDVLAKTSAPESYTNGIGFTQTYVNDFKQQNFNINVSYNFGNIQSQNKRRKKRTETEQNRGDDGGVR